MSLDQVADPLSYDPVVAGKRVARLFEITQQLGSRATDVVTLIGDDVVVGSRMPLAKSADDEAPISRAQVESWEHVTAPAFEACLEIVRMPGDPARIDERLPVLKRCLLQPALRRRIAGECRDHDQHERKSPVRDADPVARGQE